MALGQIQSGNTGQYIPYNPQPHKPDGAPEGYEYVWDDRIGTWMLQPIYTAPDNPVGGPDNPDPVATPPPTATGGTVPLSALSSTAGWPTFDGPTFKAPAPFSYGDFTAPSLDDARNEPGYAFAMEQGRKALENSAAAKGTLRTGGTLKDLFAWGNKFGEQNYGNVYNRAKTTYDTNRGNAFDNYGLNFGVSRDVYDRNYREAFDEFGSGQRNRELDFAREWDQYQSDLDLQKYLAGLGA